MDLSEESALATGGTCAGMHPRESCRRNRDSIDPEDRTLVTTSLAVSDSCALRHPIVQDKYGFLSCSHYPYEVSTRVAVPRPPPRSVSPTVPWARDAEPSWDHVAQGRPRSAARMVSETGSRPSRPHLQLFEDLLIGTKVKQNGLRLIFIPILPYRLPRTVL